MITVLAQKSSNIYAVLQRTDLIIANSFHYRVWMISNFLRISMRSSFLGSRFFFEPILSLISLAVRLRFNPSQSVRSESDRLKGGTGLGVVLVLDPESELKLMGFCKDNNKNRITISQMERENHSMCTTVVPCQEISSDILDAVYNFNVLFDIHRTYRHITKLFVDTDNPKLIYNTAMIW